MDGITSLIDMSLSKLWELVMDRQACRAEVELLIKVESPWGRKEWELIERLNSNKGV